MIVKCLFVLFTWFCVAAQANGGVIYSNFGPGMTFNTADGWGINGPFPCCFQQKISHQFTPEEADVFTSVQVALTHFEGPNSLSVVLQEDLDGSPGPVIEEFNLTLLTGQTMVYRATSVLRPTLQGGTPYWLMVVADEPMVVAGWSLNSVGDISTPWNFAYKNGPPAFPWLFSPDTVRCAFQINGIPVTGEEAIEVLISEIDALGGDGTLTPEQVEGLKSTLRAAAASVNRGNTRSACNQLRAFINQVRALVNTGTLTPERAAELIEAAEAIQGSICS